ncbi:MAG: 30S ribosomal protein S13 [Candidatus Amesbacteria bacterium GW2011_GWB1_47_26]|uniref:Small ribosomal subunit protein uS13 n=1 Tax=Candidatus Amesbacteria bacterium GW2011_GWC2_45_19 TaxID=1618366 RepID=A0A0G1M4W4_9BACT|nr:MAG: 30S ribosomal protein S13 [Candidatus Amesbacteria bacterium GW2011_GWC2_45_19]KKU38770.1 MAG: 30S ribosomal protein S13 [Candidatus Amesbacteria bacterium GW2011_GWA1_46_35]KKU69272.1 MAG: 30S ribosomal protein S13 [Microgenomates group bacterium GW2011_GWC1_47_20]KKU75096.1 MAG: 30S ribosomal protein S13 [Candidatus Amesbacteria bacterium GW2011_GWB1_47_26]KKU80393.1 MAG: 30S ribosomal protein S13 [Candidatus Amesbacteria bacterium GW2011_GWA2_47_70]
MPRIAGRDIPENKKIEFSLRYIYGIGPTNAAGILAKAKLDTNKRTKDLTAEELARLQKAVDEVKVEGDLRKTVQQNISRLKEIGSYRGHRHAKGLPVRGQRTRTNARTKRGKRMTIGALKKEVLATKEPKVEEKK